MEIHDKFYKIWLARFCRNFEQGLNIANKKHGTKAAYIILIIRDSENLRGNIDIASNLETSSIINILEEALFTCKNNKK